MAQPQETTWHRRAQDLARRQFGIEQLSAFQLRAIDACMNGHDCLIMQPTASGKSLCFILPSLLQPGLTLVISPLIALMADQVDKLTASGVRAAQLSGDMSSADAARVERQVEAGELDLLFVAPERFQSHHFRAILDRSQLGLIALDEAHCVSSWGDAFRPDYRRIEPVLHQLDRVPRMALTATADADTRDDICNSLALCEPLELLRSPLRENLTLATGYRQRGYKQLLSLLQRSPSKRAARADRVEKSIVYVATRAGVDQLNQQLAAKGLRCAGYHAGLPSEERSRVQAAFKAGEIDVLLATVAFGLGIDIPDVRRVIRLGLPSSLEALLQEIGRAGRDGAPAHCTVLFNERDVAWVQSHAQDNARSERAVDDLITFVDAPAARRPAELCDAFGIPGADRQEAAATDPDHGALEALIHEAVSIWPGNASPTFLQDLLSGKASSSVGARRARYHPLFASAVRSETAHQSLLSIRLIIRRMVMFRELEIDVETGYLSPAKSRRRARAA